MTPTPQQLITSLTKAEITLILAIRDMTAFDKIDVKRNGSKVKWTKTTTYQQEYEPGVL